MNDSLQIMLSSSSSNSNSASSLRCSQLEQNSSHQQFNQQRNSRNYIQSLSSTNNHTIKNNNNHENDTHSNTCGSHVNDRINAPMGHKQFVGCSFCRKNREPYNVVISHQLRNELGVQCPVLAKLVCPLCGATGRQAHTRSYCPSRNQIENMSTNNCQEPTLQFIRPRAYRNMGRVTGSKYNSAGRLRRDTYSRHGQITTVPLAPPYQRYHSH